VRLRIQEAVSLDWKWSVIISRFQKIATINTLTVPPSRRARFAIRCSRRHSVHESRARIFIPQLTSASMIYNHERL